MNQFIMKKLLFPLLMLLLLGTVQAQKVASLDLFHGRECPHCHQFIDWIPEIQKAYPDIQINQYEVWHDLKNQKKFQDTMSELGLEASGVPTIVVEGEVITGFNPERTAQLLQENYGTPAITLGTETKKSPVVIKTADEAGFWQKIVNWFKGFFQSNSQK